MKQIGVYQISNNINGECYIGQSTDIDKRFTQHRRALNNFTAKQTNQALKEAFLFYGLENFTFNILKVLENNDEEELNEIINQLKELEQYYIDLFDSINHGYNRKGGGGGCITPEGKAKLAKTRTGKNHTQATRDKISETVLHTIQVKKSCEDKENV